MELSPKEKWILCELGKDIRPTEIAEKDAISIHTVNTHIRSFKKKLNKNTIQACLVEAVFRKEIQLNVDNKILEPR